LLGLEDALALAQQLRHPRSAHVDRRAEYLRRLFGFRRSREVEYLCPLGIEGDPPIGPAEQRDEREGEISQVRHGP